MSACDLWLGRNIKAIYPILWCQSSVLTAIISLERMPCPDATCVDKAVPIFGIDPFVSLLGVDLHEEMSIATSPCIQVQTLLCT